ncbi:carbon-nitrogen hydrolase [Pseudomonas cavernae]|uniref:Carbon-nitrogen hydrolase n=1 Tax=Pseudomonas cavernae TaxID=2320867 RepID=A0A385Z751_9PSED|nr:carbon-nitrogen hydrolase family protein [Pseudomonas cavernae]AYC33887.1 carbon-nitrogen hydrolase [Pseudomonas cavernae]
MKVELVQLAGRDGDSAYNLERTLQAIASCAADSDLLVFPETQLCGFPHAGNVRQLAEPLDGPSVQAVRAAARERDVAVVVGMLEADGGEVYNSSLLISPEGVALRYRKTHLWPDERGLVRPGDRFATVEWRGVRIGLLICYDIEFPENARALAELGAELIVVCNGNMDPYGPVHRNALLARAQENQLFALMVNRVGPGDDGLVFAGGSAVVDPFGQVLCEAGRSECRLLASLDLQQRQAARQVYDYLADRRLPLAGERVVHADGRRELLLP